MFCVKKHKNSGTQPNGSVPLFCWGSLLDNQRFAGHLCGLRETHDVEHRGCNVAQLAAVPQGAGNADDAQGNGVGGVCGERGTVVLVHLVRIAVVGGDNHGAAFGPVILFALFWKRINKWGALAGMVSGGAMVFLWKFVIAKLGGVFAIYELLPAFIVACVAIVVVSLLTKKPDDELTKTFDKIKAELKA